jgi:hypothetical protein
LVDAVYPESEVSRRFSNLADQFASSGCKDSAVAADIRAQLADWAVIDDRLQALAQRSLLVREATPASTAFSQAARIALEAMDSVQKGAVFSAEQKKLQLDSLNTLELQAHKSQLTIPEMPAFQKLVEAASVGGACATNR